MLGFDFCGRESEDEEITILPNNEEIDVHPNNKKILQEEGF